MSSSCGTKFKYVCEIKNKVDDLQRNVDGLLATFVEEYVRYQKAINKTVTSERSGTVATELATYPNYTKLKDIVNKIEIITNEITSKISDNSDVMAEMDKSIMKNKKIASAVSSEMSSLSDKADGSTQAYKDSLGLYRRDIFKNLVFIGVSGGIIYLTRKVFMESV